jgi:hypothetical protein
MKQEIYMVSVACSWLQPVKANSMEEAIRKTEKLYKYGKGRFPREYVEVDDGCCSYWCQVED